MPVIPMQNRPFDSEPVVAMTIAERDAHSPSAPHPELPLSAQEYGEAFSRSLSLTKRFLFSQGLNGERAEELAQAAWVKGWECRQQLRCPQMIVPWVNSIARNMLMNQMRRSRRLETLNNRVGKSTSPLESLELQEILERCRSGDAEVLWNHYVEGYTTGEIGQRLGLSAVAVRVRMLRLRNSLRAELGQQRAPKNTRHSAAAAPATGSRVRCQSK